MRVVEGNPLLDSIKNRWSPFDKAKWHIKTAAVSGNIMPVAIFDLTSKTPVIHEEHGIVCGATECIREKAEAITNAPVDVHVLLKALQFACGMDAAQMEFQLQHAAEQLKVERGEIKDDCIRKDYR